MSSPKPSFGYRRAAKLRVMTQDTRYSIINTVVAHPLGLPSLVELDIALDEHKSTLYEHVHSLIDADVLTRYEHTDDNYPQNLPRVFYGLTPTGYSIVKESTAFDDISTIRDSHAIPESQRKYLDVERPDDAKTLTDLETHK